MGCQEHSVTPTFGASLIGVGDGERHRGERARAKGAGKLATCPCQSGHDYGCSKQWRVLDSVEL